MVKEFAGVVGVEVEVWLGGVLVNCRVVDVKEAWGKIRYQVRPLAGAGTVWVERIREVKNGK